MSIPFYWFKDAKVTEHGHGTCFNYCDIELIDGGSTSHSSGNINPIQEKLRTKDMCIPYIELSLLEGDEEDITLYLLDALFAPYEMGKALSEILDFIEDDLKDRVMWMKQLSDEGYYLAYQGCR